MKVLVNASNLKKGGGLQVANSFCCLLDRFPQHQFIVVLSHYLASTAQVIEDYSNVEVVMYDMPKKLRTILSGRDRRLDDLVEKEQVEVVFSIFGPSLWIPKPLHICGFARAHCVLTDSPFFSRMGWYEYIKSYCNRNILLWAFKKCANIYFTENEYVSIRLRDKLGSKPVYTVTNYYNQIFDDNLKWTKHIRLPQFDGVTLLTISANYPHKNLSIVVPTIQYIKSNYPDFKFRFVLTVTKEEFGIDDVALDGNIIFLGKIPLTECPNLYRQSDIVFSSTLLECFSAVYPEAMRMGKPIITTDLEISRSLCGDAALYYDALSPKSFGDAIYCLTNNSDLQCDLISKGKQQLKKYDNYETRATKFINILETEYNKRMKLQNK